MSSEHLPGPVASDAKVFPTTVPGLREAPFPGCRSRADPVDPCHALPGSGGTSQPRVAFLCWCLSFLGASSLADAPRAPEACSKLPFAPSRAKRALNPVRSDRGVLGGSVGTGWASHS